METTNSLVEQILQDNTENLETTFNSLMQARIQEKIQEKKIEFARNLFKEEAVLTFDQLCEEVSQLNEISKKTLGSYVKKATKDSEKASKEVNKADDKYKNLSNRIGMAREKRRFAAQSGKGSGRIQSDPEVKLYGQQDKILGDKQESLARKNKREKGIERATQRLNKEELESLSAYIAEDEQILNDILQLDEISKATLGSYIKKASQDSANSSRFSGQIMGLGITNKNDEKAHDKLFNKSVKRIKGIAKASDKLTKEQVEQIESILEEIQIEDDLLNLQELSKATLGSYIKKASKDYTSTSAVNNNKSEVKIKLKRLRGIARASDKLTKEQVEQIESILEELEAESAE